MTTTPLMSLVLPTDQGSNGVWDVILGAVFGLVDGHDHTTGKGAKVPSGGLKINADVSWSDAGVSRAITDLKAIDFTPSAAAGMVSLAGALFIDSADNELYYRTTLGSNVKLTLGAALNVAAFSGGIGGDYISVSALLSYDDATKSYWMQQQGAPRPWARIRSGDVDIYETAASIVNRVRLKSPAALAASYDVTWPAAVPGSASLVQMSSAGVLTASATGAVACGAVTVAANSSVTVSGTGQYKYTGNVTTPIPASAATANPSVTYSTVGRSWTWTNNTDFVFFPVGVIVGDVITGWKVYLNKASSSASTITAQLQKQDVTTGTVTVVGSAATNSGNSPGFVSITVTGLTETVAADTHYYIRVQGITSDATHGAQFTNTHP